jgi:hypothetical protein
VPRTGCYYRGPDPRGLTEAAINVLLGYNLEPKRQMFACKWLRAPATTEIALTSITAQVLSDSCTCSEAPKSGFEDKPCSEP